MQAAASFTEAVNPAAHFGVFLQRRGVVGFEPCIYYQRTLTAPMFMICEAARTVNVVGRIGASEGNPQEIVQSPGSKFAVVGEHHKGEGIRASGRQQVFSQGFGTLLPVFSICKRRSTDCNYTGHNQGRLAEP